jgi:hypothetical protein
MAFFNRWKALRTKSERADFFGYRFDPSNDDLYFTYSVQSLAIEQREYCANENGDKTTTKQWAEIIAEYIEHRRAENE